MATTAPQQSSDNAPAQDISEHNEQSDPNGTVNPLDNILNEEEQQRERAQPQNHHDEAESDDHDQNHEGNEMDDLLAAEQHERDQNKIAIQDNPIMTRKRVKSRDLDAQIQTIPENKVGLSDEQKREQKSEELHGVWEKNNDRKLKKKYTDDMKRRGKNQVCP